MNYWISGEALTWVNGGITSGISECIGIICEDLEDWRKITHNSPVDKSLLLLIVLIKAVFYVSEEISFIVGDVIV